MENIEDLVDSGADILPQHLLNQRNRELTSQIVHYEQQAETTQREIDEHKERLKFMSDHLVNVKAEITNTQQLFEAKRREIQTEDHLTQVTERERGRLSQKLSQNKLLDSELQEKISAVQNHIFQLNLRMDEFKAAMNFNQEELEQWDIARRQKEDDGTQLQRYAKSDEGKIKDLTLQIEKLSKQLQDQRDLLEREITETRSSQIELDKTATDYKELHKERQELIHQWEEAVKAMHRRDAAISSAADRYAEGKQWVEKRANQLKARAEFHQIELNNNKELLAKIEQQERVLAKYREDHIVLQKHITELDDEVEVMRNTLEKATHDKASLAGEKEQTHRALMDKQKQLSNMLMQHDKVVAKLKDEIEAAADLERQNNLVTDLYAQTEQSMKALDQEMTRIKEEQYHNSQALFGVRRQQTNYLAEISGAQAQGRNMAAKIAQLDSSSFKQQELLYTIEFNIQQMERKVNRAKGERTEEEKRELQEKIEMLQKMLDDLLKQHKVLDIQVKRVGDDLRQAKHETIKLEKEKQRVTEELLELTLENESCHIEHQQMTKQKEEELVTNDVLQLEVERLQRVISRRDNELLGLENRKEQLVISVQEREMEIRVHHDVLRMEAKAAEDERRRVSADLMERARQVEHLKNRYQVLIGRMDKNIGETTQAQMIVRAAKEREELQATGDSLDGQIKSFEREHRKLDKTIALLKGANAKFKHQFVKVGQEDDEVQQQKTLQVKNKEVQQIVNRRTNEMKDYLRTEMTKMSDLQDQQRNRQEVEQKIQILHDGQTGLQRDIEEQKELIARYEVAISKSRRATEPEIINDISILEEREKQDNLLAILMSVAQSKGEEATLSVEGGLHRMGIPIPTLGGPDDGVNPVE